eukprot:2056135-Prorocentrum_lima.AAC.1
MIPVAIWQEKLANVPSHGRATQMLHHDICGRDQEGNVHVVIGPASEAWADPELLAPMHVSRAISAP